MTPHSEDAAVSVGVGAAGVGAACDWTVCDGAVAADVAECSGAALLDGWAAVSCCADARASSTRRRFKFRNCSASRFLPHSKAGMASA
eukprot:4977516-Pleurochrysis_carterae.AAC.1